MHLLEGFRTSLLRESSHHLDRALDAVAQADGEVQALVVMEQVLAETEGPQQNEG